MQSQAMCIARHQGDDIGAKRRNIGVPVCIVAQNHDLTINRASPKHAGKNQGACRPMMETGFAKADTLFAFIIRRPSYSC